jgi:hypothetical protein
MFMRNKVDTLEEMGQLLNEEDAYYLTESYNLDTTIE